MVSEIDLFSGAVSVATRVTADRVLRKAVDCGCCPRRSGWLDGSAAAADNERKDGDDCRDARDPCHRATSTRGADLPGDPRDAVLRRHRAGNRPRSTVASAWVARRCSRGRPFRCAQRCPRGEDWRAPGSSGSSRCRSNSRGRRRLGLSSCPRRSRHDHRSLPLRKPAQCAPELVPVVHLDQGRRGHRALGHLVRRILVVPTAPPPRGVRVQHDLPYVWFGSASPLNRDQARQAFASAVCIRSSASAQSCVAW